MLILMRTQTCCSFNTLSFNEVQITTLNFIKKESLAQMFSCEFCEISNDTFFYRTPTVAASVFFILAF